MVGVNDESEYCKALANSVHTKLFDSIISKKNMILKITDSCKIHIIETWKIG